MTLLAKMTGFDPEAREAGAGLLSAPGEMPRLSVNDNPLATAGKAIVVNGGGYAGTVGAGVGMCLVAGLDPLLGAGFGAGLCACHVTRRVWDNLGWASRGGRLAMLKRRRYQGEASPLDVRNTLSPAFAAKHMKRLAPTLLPEQSFIFLGTTVHRPHQPVAVSRAETIAVFGVPQSLKTALIGHMILEAPGAVLATSSRADQWRHTVAVREQMGPVLVLDADQRGPGTNFAWSPVSGCESAEVAIRRAGDMMFASPRDASGKDSWHEDRGARLLRMALHAAATVGEDMYAVRAWCQDPTDPEFLKALQASRSGVDWDNGLMALCAQDGDFLTSATTSAEAALGWMDNPALAAVACPRVDGEPVLGLDVARFLREGNGTIYLIGRKRPYGSLTPYFSAFVSEFMEQAGALAEEQGGKLRVPMLVAADEAATTAKIDFAEWCALTAGWNITVVAGFQSVSQIETGWGGQAACETILDLMSTKVIAGGFTSPPALERFSGICGDYDCWRKEGGAKTWTKERVFPPERIRQLKRFHALVVHRVCKPVEIVVTPVWEHPAHQEVVIEDAPEPGEAPDEVTEE